MVKKGETICKSNGNREEYEYFPSIDESVITFQSITNEWLLSIQPRIKESTNIKYHNLLATYILPTLGKSNISNLTTACIEAYCNELLLNGGKNNEGLSPKTVSDILSMLRNILRFSENKGITSHCNVTSIIVKQQPKEMRVFSTLEQKRLCDYIHKNPTLQNLGILLCLFTGLRVGEICALQWSDISIEEKTIHVHQTMQRIQTSNDSNTKTKVIITTPKSACSRRIIPLPENISLLISKLVQSPECYFLTGKSSCFIEPRSLQYHFKKTLEECSLEHANFHALRHTFATRCVEVGFDVKTLSEILGHASVNITMNRYVHPSMELKRKNMNLLCTLMPK